jgi:hypothetical protein
MSELLGEALASMETIAQTAPDPAQVESTVSAPTDQSAPAEQVDSSLTQPDTPEQPQADEKQESRELDFRSLREQKTTLETELQTVRSRLDEFGGETHLGLMQPILERALEVPRTKEEVDQWSQGMDEALSQTLLPAQVDALRSRAAWGYLNDPESQRVIAESLYGEGITPEVLATLAQAYRDIPDLLDRLRPDETWEEREAREKVEARDKERDAQLKAIQERDEKREAEFQAQEVQRTMGEVFQIGLSPRAEVKKQYGLEFQKSDKDTPEIGAFKERASRRYDQMSTLALERDQELNRLAHTAEQWARDKDPRRRSLANTKFAPLMEQRTRQVCASVAKDLAEDLKLFSPELSDRAKAENLKDLPAQVLGSSASSAPSSGIDFSGMPDPATNPRAYEQWVAKLTAEAARTQRTPAILQG